jgi:hypothetical protein
MSRLRSLRRDGGVDEATVKLLETMKPREMARWLCYSGKWKEGIEAFRSIRERT